LEDEKKKSLHQTRTRRFGKNAGEAPNTMSGSALKRTVRKKSTAVLIELTAFALTGSVGEPKTLR